MAGLAQSYSIILQLVDRGFSSGIARASTTMVQSGNMTKGYAKQLSVARTQVRNFALQSAVAGGATLALGAAINSSLRAFGEYELGMKGVAQVTGATGFKLAQLHKTVAQLAGSTEFKPQDIAKTMRFLGQAGYSAAETQKTIKAAADLATSSMGEINLQGSAELLANISRAFGISAEDTTNVADRLTKASQMSVLGLDDMAVAMSYAATGAATYGQNLNTVLKALSIMAPITKTASKTGTGFTSALEAIYRPRTHKMLLEMGVNTQDASGVNRQVLDIYADVRAAIEKLPKGEQAPLYSKLFGVRGIKLHAGLIRAGAGTDRGVAALERYDKALAHADGTAHRFALGMRETYSLSIDKFTAEWEKLKIAIGEGFMPHARLLAQTLQPLFETMTQFMNAFGGKGGMLIASALTLNAVAAAGRTVSGVIGAYTAAKAGPAGAFFGMSGAGGAGGGVAGAGALGGGVAGAGAAANHFGALSMWGAGESKFFGAARTFDAGPQGGMSPSELLLAEGRFGLEYDKREGPQILADKARARKLAQLQYKGMEKSGALAGMSRTQKDVFLQQLIGNTVGTEMGARESVLGHLRSADLAEHMHDLKLKTENKQAMAKLTAGVGNAVTGFANFIGPMNMLLLTVGAVVLAFERMQQATDDLYTTQEEWANRGRERTGHIGDLRTVVDAFQESKARGDKGLLTDKDAAIRLRSVGMQDFIQEAANATAGGANAPGVFKAMRASYAFMLRGSAMEEDEVGRQLRSFDTLYNELKAIESTKRGGVLNVLDGPGGVRGEGLTELQRLSSGYSAHQTAVPDFLQWAPEWARQGSPEQKRIAELEARGGAYPEVRSTTVFRFVDAYGNKVLEDVSPGVVEQLRKYNVQRSRVLGDLSTLEITHE